MNTANSKSDRVVTISDLKQQVYQFVDERDWNKYHNLKNLSMSVAIEAAELMEIFQWTNEDESERALKDVAFLQRIEQEVADIIIYCLSLANVTNIDISQAVLGKIDQNKAKYPEERVKGNYRKYTEL